MAVKFTTFIKMDMNRDEKIEQIEEHTQEALGCIEEGITIRKYQVKVPCKVDKKENKRLVEALNKKFFEEEVDHTMISKDNTICFTVWTLDGEYQVDIQDLYKTMNVYIEYLEEILEEHGVKRCVLTLELYSDISYYRYD